MTVKELIEVLGQNDPNATILIEVDKTLFNNAIVSVYNEKEDIDAPIAWFNLLRESNWEALYN